MKKKLFLAMSLAMGLFVATSCSDDDNDGGNGGNPTINSNYDLAYSAENATAWGNYMVRVAELLRDDAATLYADWNSSYNGGASYASIFKRTSLTPSPVMATVCPARFMAATSFFF